MTESTRHVFLESAHFDPVTVRRTARKLGMHTDASHRFERGGDPDACLPAALRAAALIARLAGGRVLPGHLEDGSLKGGALPGGWPPTVEVEHPRLCGFAGLHVEKGEVERILGGLGFGLAPLDDERDGWRVTAPSWRWYDFQDPYPADVYEEVLRVVGLDRIPATLPALGGADAPETDEHRLRRLVRDRLAACGLAEGIHYAFHARTDDERFPTVFADDASEPVALVNPLSDRYDVLRRSLLPSLVGAVLFNQRRGADAVRLFEVGHVFRRHGRGHEEIESVGIVLSGRSRSGWQRSHELDFYDLKGIVESLAERVGVELSFRATELPSFIPGAVAVIRRADDDATDIGYLGQLDVPDATSPVFAAELRTDALARGATDLRVDPPSRYPGIDVDTTLTHALDVPWQDIAHAVREADVPDLVSFRLGSRYRGEGVPEGAVNTTIGFHYNSDSRSLTQDEVNERHGRLAAALESRFGLGRSS